MNRIWRAGMILCVLVWFAALSVCALADENCPHAHTELFAAYKDPVYAQANHQTHTVTGYLVTGEYCLICGADLIVEFSSEMKTQTVRHYGAYDNCNYCYAPNTCPHTWTETSREYLNASYEPLGEAAHAVTGYGVDKRTCLVCGKYTYDNLSAQQETAEQPHAFKNGICMDCGAENTCAHTQTQTGRRYLLESCYAVDENMHEISGYPVTFDRCTVCGEELNASLDKELYTERMAHDPAGGVCSGCGFDAACSHAQTAAGEFVSYDTYAQKDENVHLFTYTRITFDRCLNCGTWLGIKECEPVTEDEVHYFSNGVCGYCAEANPCAHEETTSGDYYHRAIYGPLNDRQHMVARTIVDYERCKNCREYLIQNEREGYKISAEDHWFKEGVCGGCGYENTCAHEHTETYQSTNADSVICTDITPETHVRSSEVYDVTVCSDCQSVISRIARTEREVKKEEHRYREGECHYCGYKNVCSHPEISSSKTGSQGTAIPMNALGHMSAQGQSVYYYCGTCGEGWEENVDPTSIAQEHIFYEFYEKQGTYNVERVTCDSCGYTSSESNIREIKDKYTFFDAVPITQMLTEMTQPLSLAEGGIEERFLRYGYTDEDESASVFSEFAIIRPAVSLHEVDRNLFDLGAFAEWEISNMYRYQLGEAARNKGIAPIDTAKMNELFGLAWKNIKAMEFAVGYTALIDGTMYCWVPVYYADENGHFHEDTVYLFLYTIRPGIDQAYLDGKMFFAFSQGFMTESRIITDQATISDFLVQLYGEEGILDLGKDARYDYDLTFNYGGTNVRELQAALVELGYLDTSIDGYFSTMTEEAVKAYQTDMGLEPTGIADVELQKMLLSNSFEKQLLVQWMKKN